MKSQKFVYNAHEGDNTKFVYIPKMEQKANFVYKELCEIAMLTYDYASIKRESTLRVQINC